MAQRCAHLHVPDPRAERDALIAAMALVHGLTVVTRNVADFALTGVALLNPWDVPDRQQGRSTVNCYRARQSKVYDLPKLRVFAHPTEGVSEFGAEIPR